jgi:hypothetical protein
VKKKDGMTTLTCLTEDEVGQLSFCYNLTWDRIGVKYSDRLQASGISLDEIETVLELGDSLRWLAIEEVEDAQAEAFLKELDERCAIPQPRSIAEQLNQTLAAQISRLKSASSHRSLKKRIR